MGTRSPSRPERWRAALAAMRAALSDVDEARSKLDSALDDFKAVRDEYEDWRDNMPEGTESSATGEKLDAVVDVDVDAFEELADVLEQCEAAIDGAEELELPLGFGRD